MHRCHPYLVYYVDMVSCIQGSAVRNRDDGNMVIRLLAKVFVLLVLYVGSIIPASADKEGTAPVGELRQQTTAGDRELLSAEERHWLSQHPRIRIGITVIPPQILRAQEEYKGLSIDYIRLLENKLGYRFELIPYPTWNDVINASKNRQIDMIFAAQQTPERLTYLHFSKPYIELPNMILVRRDHKGGASLQALKGWRVTVSEGSAVHEYLKTNFSDLILVPVQDELNGLMKVSLGEADAMVVEISRASYYIDKAGILNLRVAGDAKFLYQLRFAVRDDWPLLTDILDKGLDSITEAERETINRHWITVGEPGIFADPVFWVVLGVIILFLLAVAAWNLLLQRVVNRKTLQLRQELAERKRAEQDLLLVRFALDNVREAAFLVDEEACFRFVNEGACRVLGYTHDELLRMRVSDVDPDFPMRRWSEHWLQLKTEGSLQFEGRHRSKDGRIFPVEISANFFEYGHRDFNVALVRDITERKQAEEKILRSEQRLRLHAELSPLGFLEWDENFRAAEWNAACERIFGYSREEALGRHAKDLILPVEACESGDGVYRDLMNQKGGQHSINENVTKDGRTIIVEWFNTTLVNKDGKAIGVASICRDITELKQAEEERRLHTEFLANMDRINRAIQSAGDLEAMMQGVLDEVLDIFDCDRVYLLYPCDPAATSFSIQMERTRPEFPGAGVIGDDISMDAEISNTMRSLINNSGALQFGPGTDHSIPVSTSGRYGFKSFMATALFPKTGKPWEFGIQQCSHARIWSQAEEQLLMEVARRLTDGLTSLQILRDLRKSEARYQRMFDTANEGIWVQDENFVTTFANEHMAEMLGYTAAEITGHKVTEYMLEEDATDHARKMEDRSRNVSDVYERRMLHKDGSVVWMLISATPIFEGDRFHGSFAMLTDITERKNAEQRLVSSEQLFRTLVEHSPDYIARYDRELRRIYINPALQKQFAAATEQIIGIPPTESSPLIDPERYMGHIRQAIEMASECSDEHTYRTPDGEIRWTSSRFIPEFDLDGEVATVMVISSDITERKQAEQVRLLHANLLTSLDRVNRVIQGAGDLETMMREVLDEVLTIFDCDRAFLMYPCDPDAESWSVPMERTRPEFPGAGALKQDIPMDHDVAVTLELILATPGVLVFGPGTERPLPTEIADRYGFKSYMSLALFPKVGKPWQFGIHQCSYGRIWTEEEQKLLEEIGQRITDALTGLLVLRDLRESEEKYRRIFDTATEGIWGQDEIFDTTFVNAHMAEMLGYSVEELQGRPVTDFMFEEDLLDHQQRVVNRKEHLSEVYERRLRRKDGETIWVLISATPIFDNEGNFRGSFAMVTDITERKRAEDELVRSEEKFSRAFYASPNLMAITRPEDGLIIDINESFCHFFGYEREECIGHNTAELQMWVNPEQRDNIVQRLKQTGSALYEPVELRTKSGEIRSVIDSLVFINIGNQECLLSVATDITERKRAEKELLDARLLFEGVVQQSPVPMALAKPTGELIFNKACADFLHTWDEPTLVQGVKLQEMRQPWKDYDSQGKPLSTMDLPLAKALRGETTQNLELQVVRKDGTRKWEMVTGSPIYDSEGNLIAGFATFPDITERKEAEEALRIHKERLEELVGQRTEELRLARDEANAANKAKSAFLANMSHELRTPLNAILGFSQMMRQDTGLNRSQLEILDIINNSGEHLLKLINDVLEIAKIEAGKLQLELAPMDLQEVVREVSDMMRLRAEQKGLKLEVDQSSQFPRYINGDEARLRQILVNLLSNAVKFTERGGVTLRLGGTKNNQHHLVIEVEDTGPGISADDQKLLFKPFVQLREGAEEGGTGLGLSIVQQFVHLMGGAITVRSEPGKGSLFRVELPSEAVDDADIIGLSGDMHGEIAGMAPGQPAYRILIAEDQHDNQLLLARLMDDIGIEAKIASNGEECVKLFQEWHPDLIWMDRRMPVMDGVEATRRIRQLPGGDKVKIVAVTASAFKEQEPELRSAGLDDYIRKPFRFSEIYDSMAQQLGIKFIYSDKESEAVKAAAVPLTPKRLSVIGPELRKELKSAVESLDSTKIDAVIDLISKIDAGLAGTLDRMVKEFDYPSILEVLKKDFKNSGIHKE